MASIAALSYNGSTNNGVAQFSHTFLADIGNIRTVNVIKGTCRLQCLVRYTKTQCYN